MVKKQKDKQYQSAREHRASQQERSGSTTSGSSALRPLPFSHCALTLVPFETPVCNVGGILFDNAAVVAFILRHKIDPVTGDAVGTSSLIHLNIDKNEEGNWQCPVLTKPFSDHSKVVAILQPGRKQANVYSYEAYLELNIKAKNFEDLQSGARFDKNNDVIVLYDPTDDELNRRRDINSFYHIKHSREIEKSKEPESGVRHNVATSRVMEKIKKSELQKFDEQRDADKKRKAETLVSDTVPNGISDYTYTKEGKRLRVLAEDVTGVKFTTHQGAASSLTSTAVQVSDHNQAREATMEEIVQAQCNVMQKTLKKKGYVRMHTNHGTLTLELHCDIVPRTCMNFLALCRTNKYDNSSFHRLIPNFMLQGGKPATKEELEECIWGGSFADEFDDRLKHTDAGVLSMANAGTNTNKRQFFVTFETCSHLDRKHSVFGAVLEGKEVLKKIQRIATDKNDRPREEIRIMSTEVLVDPAKEARELEQKRLEKIVLSRELKNTRSKIVSDVKVSNDDTVGRYLKLTPIQSKLGSQIVERIEETSASRLPPVPFTKGFGDFSGW